MSCEKAKSRLVRPINCEIVDLCIMFVIPLKGREAVYTQIDKKNSMMFTDLHVNDHI